MATTIGNRSRRKTVVFPVSAGTPATVVTVPKWRLTIFAPRPTNGFPPEGDNCIASRKTLKECGAEQDWTIVGPTFTKIKVDETYEKMKQLPGVMWYNGLETGPCGEAELTVDYFCPKTD